MPDLRPFEGKKVKEGTGHCNESSTRFSIEQDGAGIVQMPPFKVIVIGFGHYIPSHLS